MERSTSVGEQASDGSRIWVPGIVACIARFLSDNEIACTLRLVDKATSQQYANCKIIRLSLPSPTYIFKACWGRPESFRRYTREQRLNLLCLTAASGSIANLEVALDNAGLVAGGAGYSDLLKAAAEAGQLDVCKMLRERGCPWGGSLAAAARGGHRHVCEWMLASGCSSCISAASEAARGGHEGLMDWLMTHQGRGRHDAGRLLRAAAQDLSLAAFQRLLQQLLTGQRQGDEAQQQQQQGGEVLSEKQRGEILGAAAGSSTPDWQAKIEWLEGLGFPRSTWVCFSAARCRPDAEAASRMQWLCSRGYTPVEDAADVAASHGNLAALRFLVEQAGVRPDEYAIGAAAIIGHLAVLQYLHTINGLVMEPQDVAGFAACGGHLPVVAWVVEALGVMPGNASGVLDSAARSGNIELLTWLHDRGWTCWGRETMANAAGSGCEEAVEWLVEQGCPWPVDGSAYSNTAPQGDLAMTRCLHRLGCPWGPDQMVDCIKHISPSLVPVLRCLLELGCSVDWDEAVRVVERRLPGEDCTALLTWLGEERQQWLLGAQQKQKQQKRPWWAFWGS